ncbi:MAG: glycine dehydrogenase, partial [Armatimonadetes bacterium]|nr:glycine dehydrogenase [Anaerolineae bacterium]
FSVDRALPFFNEFVVTCPRLVSTINDQLINAGIIGGYDLGQDDAQRADQMLLCVTEMNSKAEIDGLVEALGKLA